MAEAQRKLQAKELLIRKKFLFGDRNFRSGGLKSRFGIKIENQKPLDIYKDLVKKWLEQKSLKEKKSRRITIT